MEEPKKNTGQQSKNTGTPRKDTGKPRKIKEQPRKNMMGNHGENTGTRRKTDGIDSGQLVSHGVVRRRARGGQPRPVAADIR